MANRVGHRIRRMRSSRPRRPEHRGPATLFGPLLTTLALALGVGVPVLVAAAGGLARPELFRNPLLAPDAETSGWLGTWSDRVIPASHVQNDSLHVLLWILLSLTVLLAGVALINLFTLLLARGAARTQGMVVRAVLGAPRRALFEPLAREAGITVAAAAAGALVIGLAVATGLRAGWPLEDVPWRIGGAAIAAAAGLLGALLGVTLLAFLWPARVAWRRDLRRDLTVGGRATGGPGESLLRNALAVGQIGASLVLLVTAGLLLRGFAIDAGAVGATGAGARDTLTVQLRLPAGTAEGPTERAASYAEVLRRISLLPGALDSSVATVGAAVGIGTLDRVHGLTGNPMSPGREQPASYQAVSPSFFATHGVALIRGRTFADDEDPGAERVAIVNETFVTRFRLVGGGVGRQLQLNGLGLDKPFYTIVGVVDDVRASGIGAAADPVPRLYLSTHQHPPATVELTVRTTGDPLSFADPLGLIVEQSFPGAALGPPMSLERYLREFRSPLRWFAATFALLAAVALLLALTGLRAVMSFNVVRRTREIGLRTAVGARVRDVIRMILVQGIRVTLLGCTVGLIGAAGVGRLLQLLLTGIDPFDPLLFGALATLMTAVALLASHRPARRAATVDPQISLRAE